MGARRSQGMLDRYDRARKVNIGCMRWGVVGGGLTTVVFCVGWGLQTWQESGSVLLSFGWAALGLVVGALAGAVVGGVMAFGLPLLLLPVFVETFDWLRFGLFWAVVGGFVGTMAALILGGLDSAPRWSVVGAAGAGGGSWAWQCWGCFLRYGGRR